MYGHARTQSRNTHTKQKEKHVHFSSELELTVVPRADKAANRGQTLVHRYAMVHTKVQVVRKQLKSPLAVRVKGLAQLSERVEGHIVVHGARLGCLVFPLFLEQLLNHLSDAGQGVRTAVQDEHLMQVRVMLSARLLVCKCACCELERKGIPWPWLSVLQ